MAEPSALMAEPRVVVESVDAPARVRALHGRRARMFTTCGDTACAIHALCGEDQWGEIRMSQHPRVFLRQCFGESASVFKTRVGDPALVAQLVDVLWKELLKPRIDTPLGARGEPRPESLAVWAEVQRMMPSLAQELNSFSVSEQASYEVFKQKRMHVVDCFGAICRRHEFREGFVQKLVTSIGLAEDFAQPHTSLEWMTKMEVLFTELEEAHDLRQSVVESLGVSHFAMLDELVRDVTGAMEGDMDVAPIVEFLEAIRAAQACVPQERGRRETKPTFER